MSDYEFHLVDFDNPSIFFVMEDWLKYLFAEKYYYKPRFKSYCIKGDEKILDFGCGGGAGSKVLAGMLNKEGTLICLDISKFWTDKARRRLKNFRNAEVICGDIRTADLKDNFFDLISVIHVIHDINPADRGKTVEALAGKLKRKGKIFIAEPVKISHGIAPEELESLMKKAGLEKLSYNLTGSVYRGEFMLN